MTRWFGPKHVGWGVSPRGWQGGAATAVFLAAFIGAQLIPTHALGWSHWVRVLPAGALLVAFLLVVWLKYERD